VRGTRDTARLIAVGLVVLGALALVAMAAHSDRAPTLTAQPDPTPTSLVLPPAQTATPQPDGRVAKSDGDTSTNRMPSWLLWTIGVISVAPLLIGMWFLPAMVWLPGHGLPWFGRRRRGAGALMEVEDEVEPPPLVTVVEEGLRELDQGGPGEGVIASWVLLERAAADAGTHRAAPDTPSELAGRLIDRHPVSSTPLLRLADLYREARFSRHELPESARTEARAALEQLRSELDASPIGKR
jgi:Domain of unknown function (DUF4129)